MTQIQHLVGVVGQLAQQHQHQQMQWQQQGAQQNPAVSPPGLGPYVKARKLIDTRFVKIPFFPKKRQGLRGLVVRLQEGDEGREPEDL